jgi:hypothetical protein
MPRDHLKKLKSDFGKWIDTEFMYHVREPHLLTQAAGYLKYALAADGPVFFRGQAQTYPTMYASLYRGIRSTSGRNNRLEEFLTFLEEVRNASAFLRGTPKHAHEALLQHYGIRSRWLDLVDNVWVALWFASHSIYSTGRHNEYLHFRRRILSRATRDEYAYILLIQTGPLERVSGKQGLLRGGLSELIDLRVAAPSVFLRPHAQHGVLIRKRQNNDFVSENMEPLIAATIRIDLADALSWLGDGGMLSVHALFPPPHFDFGYRRLLEKTPAGPRQLGAIQHIGA